MIKRKNLVLHVGLPKAGSTSFQSALHSNRDNLRKQNCDYPAVDGNHGMPKHQFLVSELLAGTLNKTAKIQETHYETTILSSEGLSNHFYDFSGSALKSFRHATRSFHTKIFIILRPEKEWIRSYYSEIIFNNPIYLPGFYGTSLELSEFEKLPRVTRLIDYPKLIKDMMIGYGADEVISSNLSEPWLDVLAHAANITRENWNEPSRQNESPKKWVIEMTRQINKHELSTKARNQWFAEIQKFEKTNHLRFSNASAIGEDDQKLDKTVLQSLVPNDNCGFVLTVEKIVAFGNFLHQTGVC